MKSAMLRYIFQSAFVCTLCLLATEVDAQVGLSFQQNKWKADQWELLAEQNDSLQIANKNLKIGLHYWFRLPNHRIEFLPEIAYTFSLDRGLSAYEAQHSAWIINFAIDIYPFDLKGDCDCPTFSKQGDFFQKGFFIEVTPGVEFQKLNVIARNSDQSEDKELSSSNTAFRLAAHAGLDFGISDLITLTPFAGLTWIPNVEWEEMHTRFTPEGNPELYSSDILAFGVGVRLLLRFDEARKRF